MTEWINQFMQFVLPYLDFMAAVFIFVIALGVLGIVILYIYDRVQTCNAILNNYPVLGHFRYLFLRLGEFYRRYFSNRDWDGLPFSRAVRNWIYDASFGDDTHIRSFGSTKPISSVGTITFANSTFPTQKDESGQSVHPVIGSSVKHPYQPTSFFNVSGMSYGSLSKPAIQALSKGAAGAGCWLNTGEGGLSPYHLEGSPDIIFQIGTAKYGVRDNEGNFCKKSLKELADKKELRAFEFKLSQGAKPGKGGVLPAKKVSEEIAEIRGIPVHEDSISPNRHAEVSNITELLDFIHRIRAISEKPVGIKTVISDAAWLDELCEEIKKRGIESAPDFITVDSSDGGSGAAPMLLMDGMGLPLTQSLPFVVDKLKQHGLKERIIVIASGKLVTSLDVAWALAMGADYINSARGFMFAMGCIQAMRCHKNTCPTGITTHDKRLQKALKPEDKCKRVKAYVENVVKETEMIAHSCGLRHPRKLTRSHVFGRMEDGNFKAMHEVWPEQQNQGKKA
jgi:glutamate synthase domain-containing protein 2